MRRTELTKKTARQKGFAAAGSAALTMLFLFFSPYFLLAGVPATTWLTYRWLRYRAEWGLRF